MLDRFDLIVASAVEMVLSPAVRIFAACKPAVADTECAYAMAASFVCPYIGDRKLQPPDYAARYPGRVRLETKLSTDNVVKSAHAIVEPTDKTSICPPKR